MWVLAAIVVLDDPMKLLSSGILHEYTEKGGLGILPRARTRTSAYLAEPTPWATARRGPSSDKLPRAPNSKLPRAPTCPSCKELPKVEGPTRRNVVELSNQYESLTNIFGHPVWGQSWDGLAKANPPLRSDPGGGGKKARGSSHTFWRFSPA